MSEAGLISMGIVNHWMFSDEYIKLDFSRIDNHPAISSTIDIVKRDGETRLFIVASSWAIEGNLKTLTLTYDAADNSEVFPGREFEDFWGTAKIDIDIAKWTAKATWVGAFSKKWNGTADVTIIRSGLTEKKKRVLTTRLERQQQRLRKALLVMDKRCAISGEEMSEVLDAAHIIGAANGGREIIENAILLRADLHRLLDSGKIRITSTGQVVENVELPDNYRELLRKRQLPIEVFARVEEAIAIVSSDENWV